ncbi:hypothetical protein PVAP13_6NG161606 [Panicum virgatum]|uniref:Uncharacterized protein n=1 Tax=Panicum virgatum TaxID=38727 RepID=A0A8T0QXB3_PANVG|nr:hypothetical protein PVAP13_6NG161606 [Panicum virgatum]
MEWKEKQACIGRSLPLFNGSCVLSKKVEEDVAADLFLVAHGHLDEHHGDVSVGVVIGVAVLHVGGGALPATAGLVAGGRDTGLDAADLDPEAGEALHDAVHGLHHEEQDAEGGQLLDGPGDVVDAELEPGHVRPVQPPLDLLPLRHAEVLRQLPQVLRQVPEVPRQVLQLLRQVLELLLELLQVPRQVLRELPPLEVGDGLQGEHGEGEQQERAQEPEHHPAAPGGLGVGLLVGVAAAADAAVHGAQDAPEAGGHPGHAAHGAVRAQEEHPGELLGVLATGLVGGRHAGPVDLHQRVGVVHLHHHRRAALLLAAPPRARRRHG